MIRKVALVAMIVADIGMLTILALNSMWFWFTAFCIINAVIIIAEILSVLARGKTISTFYKYWIEEKPIAAYGALLLMGVAFLALLIHLGVV